MAGGRFWTEEEDELLRERVGKVSFPTIAKNLNRTLKAVVGRAENLGISHTKFESGKLTANELANALQVDSHAVYRWVKRDGLKAIYKVTRKEAKFYLIDVKDFWKWAESNKEKLNFFRIDPLALLPEPDWVGEERKKDFHSIPKNARVKWRQADDEWLISLLKGNYSMQEISVHMNRTEKAVRRRISRLREWGTIPKKKISLRWTEKEIQMFLELENQGLSDVEIAYELGREEDHIVDKRARMRRAGLYKKARKTRVG